MQPKSLSWVHATRSRPATIPNVRLWRNSSRSLWRWAMHRRARSGSCYRAGCRMQRSCLQDGHPPCRRIWKTYAPGPRPRLQPGTRCWRGCARAGAKSFPSQPPDIPIGARDLTPARILSIGWRKDEGLITPRTWKGLCPSARRKGNQRDRGSLRCARTTRADSPCGLHSPFSAKAKVASADATQGQQREGKRP